MSTIRILRGFVTANLIASLITLGIASGAASQGGPTSKPVTAATETAGPLPAPWTSLDVGFPLLAGSAGATSTTFVVDAAGTDIGGSSDEFHFAYQLLNGDGEIVARVESLLRTHTWARAGVMIRESLAGDSRHGFAFVSGGQGAGFLSRTTTSGSTASMRGARVRTPFWVRLVRSGATFEAYESQDGVVWSLIGRETLTLPQTVYAGLAVTSHDAGALTTAIFSGVAVRETGLSNQPPTASITSPATGATFTAPATITVAADATDSDGTLGSVDFYAGSTLIGTDMTAPYSVTWNGVPAGSYALTAVATDDVGATTISAAVSVVVTSSSQPPSVALTSPSDGFSFVAPAAIGFTANAADADGSISAVEFFAGSTLLGADTTSPYSLVWNVLSPGAYNVTAVAVDNSGARTTSASITVIANPSYAVFAASADHDTLVTSYRLELFVAGADPNTATPVAVQDLAKPTPVNGEISVDITARLQPLAPGNYVATVLAIGSGGTSRSEAAAFVR